MNKGPETGVSLCGGTFFVALKQICIFSSWRGGGFLETDTLKFWTSEFGRDKVVHQPFLWVIEIRARFLVVCCPFGRNMMDLANSSHKDQRTSPIFSRASCALSHLQASVRFPTSSRSPQRVLRAKSEAERRFHVEHWKEIRLLLTPQLEPDQIHDHTLFAVHMLGSSDN